MTTTHTDGLAALDPTKIQTAITRLNSTPNGQQYINEAANGDERFALWLKLVDSTTTKRIGLTHRDLPDWTWRDAFDDGLSAPAAYTQACNDGLLS